MTLHLEHDIPEGMQRLTVYTGQGLHGRIPQTFVGRWLVAPDEVESRTQMPNTDEGTYWGVAETRRGQIAVYVAHANDLWPAHLTTYADLDEATDDLPADILSLAAKAMGEDRPVVLDI